MKRLNRKGFTLVELLAVIVILAIVVGITLITVLPTLKKSRQEAFNLTAQTAADYYEKQYQLYMIGETADITVGALTDVDYAKAGLKAGNYDAGNYQVDSASGRVCVTLKAKKASGADYYDVDTDIALSTGCNGTALSLN